MKQTYLINGGDALATIPGFRLIGRKEKFDELCTLLTQSTSNNVIAMGPAGVGITALFYGLQARKADPDCPYEIRNKRLFMLDTDNLFALGDSTTIAKHMKNILQILDDTPDSVLFIEDTIDFIEGLSGFGLSSVINALNALVKRHGTQAFLEIREDSLTKLYKTHSDFKEHYTLFTLDEPVDGELDLIVDFMCDGLSKHYNVPIDIEARRTAVLLTNKYKAVETGLAGAQPKRTFSLLDRTLSRYCRDAHSKPAPGQSHEQYNKTQDILRRHFQEMRNGEKQVVQLRIEMNEAIEMAKSKNSGPNRVSDALGLFGGSDDDSSVHNPEVDEKRELIGRIEQELVLHREAYNKTTLEMNSALRLSEDAVYAEFSRLSNIDEPKLRQNDTVRLINLGGLFKTRIFGQDEAVEFIYDQVKVWKRGRRTGKPLPFLLCGPSGVGKTEVARTLALGLFDSEKALNKYDMGEYQEKNAVAKLIGAPPGYEGFEVGGQMTQSIRKTPMQVMLQDEVEKAHKDVFNVYLGILDDGFCKDNLGRMCDFSDAIMPFTTNIGQDYMLRVGSDMTEAEAYAATVRDLEGFFRNEFLNRFDGRANILVLKKLGVDSMVRIANREIERINAFWRPKGVSLEPKDADDLLRFCRDTYRPNEGARGIPGRIRALEKIIVNRDMELETQGKKLSGQLRVSWWITHDMQKFVPEWLDVAAAA